MDKKELNELFAVHVMGLVPGVDFGKWPEHVWKTRRECDPEEYAKGDPEGDEVAPFAMESGYHNGPACTRCRYSYCQNCQEGPDEPCEKEVPNYSGSAWQIPHIIKKLHELDDELDIRFDITYSKELEDFKPRVTIVDCNPNFRGASANTYEEALVMAALRWRGVLE